MALLSVIKNESVQDDGMQQPMPRPGQAPHGGRRKQASPGFFRKSHASMAGAAGDDDERHLQPGTQRQADFQVRKSSRDCARSGAKTATVREDQE